MLNTTMTKMDWRAGSWWGKINIIGFMLYGSLSAQTADTCRNAEITFVTSALERIVDNPAEVLADEEAFWEEEDAQKYVEAWGRSVGVSIERDPWRKSLQQLADMTKEERARSPLLKMTAEVIAQKEEFRSLALPHLCSYLPKGIALDIPVYFTAYVPPRCFVTGGVVFNVSADYWKGNTQNILNSLVHELFHVGYSRNRQYRREQPGKDDQLFAMMESLQNEGTATWVGYQAQSLFPAPDEKDYSMLDDVDEVTRQLGEVNTLFAEVGSLPDREMKKMSWDIGVEQRAYYIVGAHMASVIERGEGRRALVHTIAMGPRAFIDTYNELVSGDRRIVYPDTATVLERRKTRSNQQALQTLGFLALAVIIIGGGGWLLRRFRAF